LKETPSLQVGPFSLPLPWLDNQVKIETNLPAVTETVEKVSKRLIGKPLPSFKLLDERRQLLSATFFGKPTILTFLNSWSPLTFSQLAELEKIGNQEVNKIVIFSQESASSVEVFKKRGNYDLKIIADPKGELAELVGLESIPTHVYINRKAVVQEVILGVLDKEDLLKNLKN
jgi:hypothetical protein